MKYDVYVVGKETEHIRTFYCGDSALQFIYENDYKIYSVYHASHDRVIFEVM